MPEDAAAHGQPTEAGGRESQLPGSTPAPGPDVPTLGWVARLPPELLYSGIYVTADVLGYDRSLDEAEVASILGNLSAYDCMGMVGRLSAAIYVQRGSFQRDFQLRLVDWLTGFDPDLRGRLRAAVVRDRAVAVFEQQLVHLARLVAAHASPRASDEFGNGSLQRDFLSCLFSVPDLLEQPEVDLRDHDQRLSWALRHCGIGQREDRLTLWSAYYEVFRKIWPTLEQPGVPDADAAFERYTGMSIQDFMTVGFAFAAGLGATNNRIGTHEYVQPADYFSTTELDEAVWGEFLKTSATSLGDFRDRLRSEDERWGKARFGSLEIEKTPLLLGPDGRCYLISMGALERRVTHGILHLLAEGSMEEGHDREHFTSPFGAAFQHWAEACVTRSLKAAKKPPTLFADVPYGPKRAPRRTSDIVLRYPKQLVVTEVVAGPLQARTVTRGDLEAFDRDVTKLIEKKATQLTNRIADILSGETAGIGLDAEGVGWIWPVIITATPFPHRPEIGQVIRNRLKKRGLLTDPRVKVLSIISAEELAAAEGAMETGTSLLELLQGWKRSPASGDHSFKNFLIDREPDRRRPPARHHKQTYEEASNLMVARVLRGSPVSPP